MLPSTLCEKLLFAADDDQLSNSQLTECQKIRDFRMTIPNGDIYITQLSQDSEIISEEGQIE